MGWLDSIFEGMRKQRSEREAQSRAAAEKRNAEIEKWLKAYEALEKGSHLYQSGRFQEALPHWDEAIDCRLEPRERHSPEAFRSACFIQRAMCLHELCFFLDAIDDLSSAVALTPDDSHIYYVRAKSRYGVTDYDGSITDYHEAIRLLEHDPNRASHEKWAQENGYDSAKAMYEEMLEPTIHVAAAHKDRSAILKRLSELVRVYPDLDRMRRKAKGQRRDCPDSHAQAEAAAECLRGWDAYSKAMPLYDEKRWEEALPYLDKAIDCRYDVDNIAPTRRPSALCYSTRAICLHALGCCVDAIDDLNNAIVLAPSDSLAYFWRGMCRGEIKAYDGAIGDFQEAMRRLESDPNKATYEAYARETGCASFENQCLLQLTRIESEVDLYRRWCEEQKTHPEIATGWAGRFAPNLRRRTPPKTS
jgi:tetratricopeptide (TPR) repeat protein